MYFHRIKYPMKHSFWHTIPIVKLFLPFSIGIGVSMFYPLPYKLSIIGFFCFFLFAIWINQTLVNHSNRWYFGLCVNLCLLLGGFALHGYQNELRSPLHFSNKPTATKILVSLDEEPVVKETTYKIKVNVLAVLDSNNQQEKANGSLIVYVQKKSPQFNMQYGDVWLLPIDHLKSISPPQNPDEFNYKRFLAFNHIYNQLYVRTKDIKITPFKQANKLRQWAYSVQHYFKSILTRNIASANETAVAQALLYGFDDDINAETIQAYSNTGTLHVLAVSGMHVGIIYMLFMLFLKPLDKLKRGILVKNIVILIALWLYSLLCGLSPSILRATVMFSFIIVSTILGTRSSVYNTLAASAFVLLTYDTNMLANVGFQLSYLAVLGIVFFQPIIASWYVPRTWLMQQIWSITAVSLAAQLITFPIGLLYFHQFPNCFLFSNLIIIPLTTIILYLGIVLLVIGQLSWLSWLLGQLLFYLISFTNTIVLYVEKIPFAYVNGIHISIFQSLLLYGIIGSISAYFLLKRIWQFQLCLLMGIVFMTILRYNQITHASQQRVLIYNIQKHTAIQIIQGNTSILMADSALLNNSNKMKFHIQQHIWKSGIHEVQKVITDMSNWKSFTVNNTSFLVSGNKHFRLKNEPTVLIIQNELNLSEIMQPQTLSRVIISSAVKPESALLMMDWLKKRNIVAEYVGEKGAIEVSLLK
jgi:competence protein ComEC